MKSFWRKASDILPAVVAVLVLLFLHRSVHRVFTILVLAVFFALLFAPMVDALRRRLRLSGPKSTGLVYGVTAVLLISLSALLIPVVLINLSDILSHLETVRARVETLSPVWYTRLNLQGLFQAAELRMISFVNQLGSLCIQAAEVLVVVVAALVLSFYMIRDREKLLHFVQGLFPLSWRSYLCTAGRRARTVWTRFIGGQLLLALLIGLLEMAGLLLLGVPYPYFFGFIGGLSNLIPYVGPFLGAAPSVLAALYEGGGLYRVMGVVLLFVAVQQLDNWFLTPRIMKGRLGLHPSVTILAVLIGAELFGFFGAALAVPVAGILWAFKP